MSMIELSTKKFDNNYLLSYFLWVQGISFVTCDAKTEAKLKMHDIRTFQILGWNLVNLILIARLQSKV